MSPKKRVPVWQKSVHQPNRFIRLVKRFRRQELAVIGAIIVIGTFIVNDILVDETKRSNEEIAKAAKNIAERDDWDALSQTLNEIHDALIAGPQKAPRSKEEQATADLYAVVRETQRTCQKAHRVDDLVRVLPQDERKQKLENEVSKAATECKTISTRTLLNLRLYPTDAQQHFEKVYGHATVEQLRGSNALFSIAIDGSARVAESLALRATTQGETLLALYKAFSILLYVTGWSLSLGGKLFGQPALAGS